MTVSETELGAGIFKEACGAWEAVRVRCCERSCGSWGECELEIEKRKIVSGSYRCRGYKPTKSCLPRVYSLTSSPSPRRVLALLALALSNRILSRVILDHTSESSCYIQHTYTRLGLLGAAVGASWRVVLQWSREAVVHRADLLDCGRGGCGRGGCDRGGLSSGISSSGDRDLLLGTRSGANSWCGAGLRARAPNPAGSQDG